jgi:hypothetical protein
MEKLYRIEKTERQLVIYCRRLMSMLLTALAFFIAVSPLQAQSQYVTPDGDGDITFTPGLRIQTRYAHDKIDGNNDFFIRRLRLKGKGGVYGLASYYFEVKLDNAGKFNIQPRAQVENAWLNFPINPAIAIRVGLYDMVFSRNALTSDSKLLLMDRSLIKGALTVLGIADNTVGILVHGRPLGGRLTYGFGIFDNIGFEQLGGSQGTLSREADGAMTTGRLVYDFLDPAKPGGYGDYRGSYIGKGRRLSIGANGAYLSKATIDSSEFSLFAWGFDLFFNSGPFTAEAEYDSYKEDIKNGGTPDINGDGWYAQAGFLVHPSIELAGRYQELDPSDQVESDKLKWTSLGINYYMRDHNLKMQAEYLIKKEETEEAEKDNNLIQVQLQFDF